MAGATIAPATLFLCIYFEKRICFVAFVVMKRDYITPAQKQWLERHPELTPTGSMLRRSAWHDYCNPCIYMLTLVVQDRKPLLGELCGPDDNHSIAWVKKSPLGQEVKKIWNNIPNYYPQVKLLSLCIMPDHIHGILQVKEQLPRHLGHVVNGFKKGCNDVLRGGVLYSEAVPRTTQHHLGNGAGNHPHPALGIHLWQQGYHDRIVTRKGQLTTLFRYLNDNPRRLWLKRHRPEYFSIINGVEIAQAKYNAMGNTDIMKNPFKCAVQCSRSLTKAQIEETCIRFLTEASAGTVLVSPCISPGEKAVIAMAMHLGYPVIVLMDNGFNPMSKPSQRFIDACHDGNALFIAPIERHLGGGKITREQCHQLNALAAVIATL